MTKRSTTPTPGSAKSDRDGKADVDDTQSSIHVSIASGFSSGERQRSPDAELEAIHETQNSFAAVSSKRETSGAATPGADTLLSTPGIADESQEALEERLGLLEAEMGRLAARVRLLEKQEPPGAGLLHWVLALLLFVALAVTWRLVFAP